MKSNRAVIVSRPGFVAIFRDTQALGIGTSRGLVKGLAHSIMAVSTPFVIAIFSLLFAVDTVVNEFLKKGRTYFWSKVAFAAFGLLLSILPVIIGISVFIRTKGSRVKVLQKAVLSYLTGDMYNELNYRLWLKKKSVYSNILNEQVEFYRDDYIAVLLPGEAEKIQLASNYATDSFSKIDFGFESGDSRLGEKFDKEQELQKKQERYDAYFTELVQIQITESKVFTKGTLIVKDNFCQYSKGCIFIRGDDGKLDNKGDINENEHMTVRYNKVYHETCLGELKVEADYDPWSFKVSITMKCNSFPQGKTQTIHGDTDDYINLIKLVEYYDVETGWIVMKKGEIRVRSRGASIFHGTDFLNMVVMIRNGYDLYEINIDTEGEPCLVE